MSVGYFRYGPKSGLPGHGQTIPRQRYAWPAPVLRGTALYRPGKDATYLKTWGSRPAKGAR